VDVDEAGSENAVVLSATPGGRWPRLVRHLRGLVCDSARVAGFMRPRQVLPPGSWAAFVAVVAATLIIQFAMQAAEAGFLGQPTPYGLPGALFPVALVALAVAIVAVGTRRGSYTLPMLTVVLGAALLMGVALTLAAYAVEALPPGHFRREATWAFDNLPPLWLALAAAVALWRSLDLDLRGALLGLLGSLAIIGWPLTGNYIDRTLWVQPADTSAATEREALRDVVSEDVLFLQPQLLQRDLDALAPPTEGVPNLYLVSVAGYAGQDVFMREADSVDRLFRERFGTAGHSIRLINNPRTIRERPLATRTALAWTLKRVGGLMNRDHDVLFLFLTSHGSHDHRFSLSFWPLGLYDLTPSDLRALLDDAGIQNRVIVISACYSGGFVDALKDPHTLVITAAAGDRTSFGCSNEADFTWFGRAYFDEALRKTRSFTEAFALAAPVVAERERHEGFDPSNPQMVEGREIAAPLAVLQRMLEKEDAPGPAAAYPPSGPSATIHEPTTPVR
jgi:hypothetical protein